MSSAFLAALSKKSKAERLQVAAISECIFTGLLQLENFAH